MGPAAQALGEDAPLKQDDHGADAVRYGAMATRMVWQRWTSTVAEGLGPTVSASGQTIDRCVRCELMSR